MGTARPQPSGPATISQRNTGTPTSRRNDSTLGRVTTWVPTTGRGWPPAVRAGSVLTALAHALAPTEPRRPSVGGRGRTSLPGTGGDPDADRMTSAPARGRTPR